MVRGPGMNRPPHDVNIMIDMGEGGVDYTLSDNEIVLFSYRSSVKCFAGIDIFFSLLSLLTGAGIVALIGLIGPILGFKGASSFNRCFILVYLVVLFVKTIDLIILLFTQGSFWNLLLAVIQIWITRIVYTFYRALTSVTSERLEVMKQPGFLDRALALNEANASVVQVRYY